MSRENQEKSVPQIRRVGLVALVAVFLAPKVVATDYELYFLGGQSNMDGYGMVEELPKDLRRPSKSVRIFHGSSTADGAPARGLGIWSALQPGHGFQFASDGTGNRYSDRFGLELSFARRLHQLRPEANIALLKYSRGGTSIDARAANTAGSWDPHDRGEHGNLGGINQYDHFLATLRRATSIGDIDGDGKRDTLHPRGILWMQGESDAAFHKAIATDYEENLRELMELLRAALRVDDLPIVVGRISDSGQWNNGTVWKHGDIVRQAQANFVESDGRAALVTDTDSYGYSDPFHYDSAGYLDLGECFAEAMHELLESAGSK